MPFVGENDELMIQQICNGFLSFPIGFDKKLQKLILCCTDLDPIRRPTIEEILNDNYFNDEL